MPGDIIELKTGDVVPADARLLHSVNLEADEAALTGESVPVRKEPNAVFGRDEKGAMYDVGPGDRLNIVFSSTTLTKGRGRAVVFATGLSTEIGAIAAALRDDGGAKRVLKKSEDGTVSAVSYLQFAAGKVWDFLGEFLGITVGTPLQRKLSKLFLTIFAFAIVCAIVVLAANKFASRNDVIIYAIATALGTLPVTLVLVLTITMAAGTKVMVGRHVLVRNMRSLEALGGVTSKYFGTSSKGPTNIQQTSAPTRPVLSPKARWLRGWFGSRTTAHTPSMSRTNRTTPNLATFPSASRRLETYKTKRRARHR